MRPLRVIRRLAAGLTVLVGALHATAGASPAQCVWGGFDASRLNYPGAVVATGDYATLRSLIANAGGTLATPTATLTTGYLGTVDVFYTSLLSARTGTLSAAEKTALLAFVRGGGTLIVTGDALALSGYTALTDWLGLGTWTLGRTCIGTATPSDTHALTTGITTLEYCTQGVFTTGLYQPVLLRDAASQPFLVAEEGGVAGQGRVVVVGDHNLFTDPYVGRRDNRTLLSNIVYWSCGKCVTKASWTRYGTGLAGANGVPDLAPSADPVHGQSLVLTATNSSGRASQCLWLIGFQRAAIPFLGGTLLTRTATQVGLPMPVGGLAIPMTMPPPHLLCGPAVTVQVLQLDAAAPGGVAFSRGLELRPGH